VFVWVYLKLGNATGPGVAGGATFGFYAGVLYSFPMFYATHLLFNRYTSELAWINTVLPDRCVRRHRRDGGRTEQGRARAGSLRFLRRSVTCRDLSWRPTASAISLRNIQDSRFDEPRYTAA
jgi:hypothetical protein